MIVCLFLRMGVGNLTLDDLAWNPFGEGDFEGILDSAVQKLEPQRSFYTFEFKENNTENYVLYFIEVGENACVVHAMYFGSFSGTRKVSAQLRLSPYMIDNALEGFAGINEGDRLPCCDSFTYINKPPKQKPKDLIEVLKGCVSEDVVTLHDYDHRQLMSVRPYHLPEIIVSCNS